MSGNPVAAYDLSSVGLMNPTEMTFAPSTDSTDDPAVLNLFVADSGNATSLGGVTEVTLAAPAVTVAATVDTGTLVQTIATSAWSPASPDPSGVTWLPGVDNLVVVDSEVDETTGAGWHDVNMWQTLRTGTVTRTGTFWGPNAATFQGSVGYTREPTGVGYDPATNTLFVSDDNAKGVFVVKAGTDSQFGNSDDVVTKIQTDVAPFSATDTEDPTFDPSSGHLFILSGKDSEIYDVDPVDGVFANGNDSVTSFDISGLGPTDWEGLVAAPSRGTLYVGARKDSGGVHQVFEITHGGTLVRRIDISVPTMTFVSGLGLAPATNGPGMDLWIVDRAVDNGANRNENDGKLFEISVPNLDTPFNTPPVAADDTASTIHDQSVNIDVLGNDSDADGEPSPPSTPPTRPTGR